MEKANIIVRRTKLLDTVVAELHKDLIDEGIGSNIGTSVSDVIRNSLFGIYQLKYPHKASRLKSEYGLDENWRLIQKTTNT
jgi:hypothetical protein